MAQLPEHLSVTVQPKGYESSHHLYKNLSVQCGSCKGMVKLYGKGTMRDDDNSWTYYCAECVEQMKRGAA